MKILFFTLAIYSMTTVALSQKIYLYPSSEKVTIDGFKKDNEPPYIEHFTASPDSANGAAILICPGGSYTMLADQHEGLDVAKFYTKHGYQAFVLHYRVNEGDQSGHRFPDQFRDVTMAIRIIKSRAKSFNIDPDRVGILGFSAGGHLASMCATMHLDPDKKSKKEFELVSSRPAFAILIYPVITLSGPAAHNYSREMLLGKDPAPQLVDTLSTHNRVNENTPPSFLVYATDDDAVPPENGLLFYEALRKHKVPASLHIYDHGGHGFGMAPTDPVLNTWTQLSLQWLRRLKIPKAVR